MKLVIWGARGHSKVVIDAVQSEHLRLIAVGDSNPDVASPFDGIPIFHNYASLMLFLHDLQSTLDKLEVHYVVAIGGDRGIDRLNIGHDLENLGLRSVVVRHPKSAVSQTARIGAGCQVLANSSVGPDAILGHSVIVNTGAIVEHECKVGDGVHIAPGATVLGEVTVDRFAFIGANATVLPRIQIGEGAVIGAGAVVTKDVPAFATVRGVPAR